MPLQGKAKADYQRDYKKRKRSPSGSPITNQRVSLVPPISEGSPPGSPPDSRVFKPQYADFDVPPELVVPQRTAGKAPEESGYPEGQVEVHTGTQGQNLWRLRGFYNLPNKILCDKA